MCVTANDQIFESVLDSLAQQMAIVDNSGQIHWVNHAWKKFSAENGGHEDRTCRGANYLDVCRRSYEAGVTDAGEVLAGIRRVINGDEPSFAFEYPCHSPTEQRWFMMRFNPLAGQEKAIFVVTHQNITERKLAELKVQELSTTDSLTGVANRRRFEQFFENQWQRNARDNAPVSMALVDVDFFKEYNDNYGHLAGDECLRDICEVMRNYVRRSGELVARYGGDEFAIVLGSADEKTAFRIAEEIRAGIQDLNILHEYSASSACVTVSIGVATVWPGERIGSSKEILTGAADKSLYKAKELGRNCVFSEPSQR